MEFVVSDDHAGLKRAVRELLPEAVWQRCYVHFLRNALDSLPRKADDDCRQELRWLNFVRREVCVAERLQQLDSGVLRQMQLVPLRKLHESLVLRFPSTGGQLCRSFLNCLGHDNGGARQSPSSRTNAHTASSPFFLQLSGLE